MRWYLNDCMQFPVFADTSFYGTLSRRPRGRWEVSTHIYFCRPDQQPTFPLLLLLFKDTALKKKQRRKQMLIPAFQLHLNQNILPGRVTVGKFDGKHASLACASSIGKVFVHSPFEPIAAAAAMASPASLSSLPPLGPSLGPRAAAATAGAAAAGSVHAPGQGDLQFFNFNRPVTALSAGPINPSSNPKGMDYLLIGSESSVSAYNVLDNSDLFYREVADGCSQICFGVVGTQTSDPLAVVGGNCSIQGFDGQGVERFWTVTGDNVTAIALIDVDEDGVNELLVGSADYQIRIFQNEEVLSECHETAEITNLCAVRHKRYGFSLANGAVGVYDSDRRLWRMKNKNAVGDIDSFDLDGDGQPELLAGWSNGRFEVRSDDSGELIFKDTFSSGIAGIVKADYRSDGRTQVICCTESGEVRGYLPADAEMRRNAKDSSFAAANQAALNELRLRKEEYLAELRMYEDVLRTGTTTVAVASGSSKDKGAAEPSAIDDSSTVPASTQITYSCVPNFEKRCLDIVLKSSHPHAAFIRLAVVSGESLFNGESVVFYNEDSRQTLPIPIRLQSTAAGVVLQIDAYVGSQYGTKFTVIFVPVTLPKFAMLTESAVDKSVPIRSRVSFRCNERPNRLVLWVKSAFLWSGGYDGHSEELHVWFKSLETGLNVYISRLPLNGGTIVIGVDDMEVAGDIAQDLFEYLKLTEVESEALFPQDMEKLKGVLSRVEEANDVRAKMTAGMADASQQIKGALLAAEDSRLLSDMSTMQRMYTQLMVVNRGLTMDYSLRSKNHSALLAALKEVNQFILKASRLRNGEAKSGLVNACRAAIKGQKLSELFKIIQFGRSE